MVPKVLERVLYCARLSRTGAPQVVSVTFLVAKEEESAGVWVEVE